MLYSLTQEQLAHTLMPLGEYTKGRTRQVARSLKLPVAERPESQEICFVQEGDYRTFLETYYRDVATPGPIVDLSGNVLGQHRGIAFYTIGQRRGLGIAAPHPLYVVAIEPETNTIVVGPEKDLWSDTLVADHLNLVAIEALREPVEVMAKVRYRSPEAEAVVIPLGDDTVELRFRRAQRAVTPGQAVVFYDGDVLIGGATIARADARQPRRA
ncbi:MAG: hypothetical protein M1531_06850 [Chloroflexi bacterium]|nr:hypothetical protein [Chloroflexota bacterium]